MSSPLVFQERDEVLEDKVMWLRAGNGWGSGGGWEREGEAEGREMVTPSFVSGTFHTLSCLILKRRSPL